MNMTGMGGLIELVLVFSIVLGFGFIELRSIKRDRLKAEEKARAAEAALTSRGEGERS